MTATPERLRYHADVPLATARHIEVVDGDGGGHASLRRDATSDGRPMWHWSGGDVPPFVVEDEGDQHSFLVTRVDGVPFGRIRLLGWLRVRLEAHDARTTRLVVEPDGDIADPDGIGLGHLEVADETEAVLEVTDDLDDTHRTLLLATPLCRTVGAPLLLR